jgi:hypothetical protein
MPETATEFTVATTYGPITPPRAYPVHGRALTLYVHRGYWASKKGKITWTDEWRVSGPNGLLLTGNYRTRKEAKTVARYALDHYEDELAKAVADDTYRSDALRDLASYFRSHP